MSCPAQTPSFAPGTPTKTASNLVSVPDTLLATLTYRASQGLICCKARDREARRADSLQADLTDASATVEKIPGFLRHERKISRWEGAGLVTGALVGLKLGGPLGAVGGAIGGAVLPRIFQKKKHRFRPD